MPSVDGIIADFLNVLRRYLVNEDGKFARYSLSGKITGLELLCHKSGIKLSLFDGLRHHFAKAKTQTCPLFTLRTRVRRTA